jgi:thymidylate synthase
MIVINANTTSSLWRNALSAVVLQGGDTGNNKYYRDIPLLLEIDTPDYGREDSLFPMPQTDLDIINRYICTGEDEDNVVHEWTKLYYHRIFDQPHSQFDYLITLLGSDETHGSCQISLWDKALDQYREISPCTQIIWARKRGESLEFHVHAHSSDAYKKLLMNLQEFIALHHCVAQRSGLRVGKYIHFIDSCHVHQYDQVEVRKLVSELGLSSQ